jgi:hypothetical protein
MFTTKSLSIPYCFVVFRHEIKVVNPLSRIVNPLGRIIGSLRRKLVPVEILVVASLCWRQYVVCSSQGLDAVGAESLVLDFLGVSLDGELFVLFNVGVLAGDGGMGNFPLCFEALKFLTINFPAVVDLEVFFDLGNSSKFLDYFLVVAATLGSGAVVEVLLKSFEDLANSKIG